MKKTIKWIAFITWLIIIFIFSHQPNSGDTTHGIIENIIPILKNSKWLDIINYIIRKLAHITEYLILSLLTISLMKEYTKKEKIIILFSILFCFFYACTDEFHQSLIVGRTSKFTDALIDTVGSLIGIIIYKIKLNTKKDA
ncbi:MAG: VanZ family protein [Bacilli bacterium]|nr:VanZ family protein [Bacilli bacterium]